MRFKYYIKSQRCGIMSFLFPTMKGVEIFSLSLGRKQWRFSEGHPSPTLTLNLLPSPTLPPALKFLPQVPLSETSLSGKIQIGLLSVGYFSENNFPVRKVSLSWQDRLLLNLLFSLLVGFIMGLLKAMNGLEKYPWCSEIGTISKACSKSDYISNFSNPLY